MGTPQWHTAAKSPFLERVLKLGFQGYQCGGKGCFFELLGMGVFCQALEMREEKRTWGQRVSKILEKTEALNQDWGSAASWSALRAAVISTILSHTRDTTYSAPCFRSGELPDMCNQSLIELITSSLGIYLVWYEELDGQDVTRCFPPEKESEWALYVYMGAHGKDVYYFYHEDVKTGQVGVGLNIKGQWKPSLTLGKVLPEDQELNEGLIRGFMEMMMQVAQCAQPEKLTEEDRSKISTIVSSWPSLSFRLQDCPLSHFLPLSSFHSLLTRLNLSEITRPKSPPSLVPSRPHTLRDCMQYTGFSDNLIYHGKGMAQHWYHRECLHDHLITEAARDMWPIRCPRCPQPFHLDLVYDAFPEAASLKEERLKEYVSSRVRHFTR